MSKSVAPEKQTKANHPAEGHRRRLREKFLRSGLDGFHDYEIVELLLTLGTPRRDCKQAAKETIKRFGGLREVLDSPPEELQHVKGIGPSNYFGLKLFQEVAERLARENVPEKIMLGTSKSVAVYLQKAIGRKQKEHFTALYLNSRNQLIYEERVSIGTINASIVHPREVFLPAVKKLASQVIVSHNHPSDDPTPSSEDVALTRRLQEAARIFDIDLLDHIIVTRDKYLSFKEQNLM